MADQEFDIPKEVQFLKDHVMIPKAWAHALFARYYGGCPNCQARAIDELATDRAAQEVRKAARPVSTISDNQPRVVPVGTAARKAVAAAKRMTEVPPETN